MLKCDYGLKGTGYAGICSFTIQLLVLIIALLCTDIRKSLVWPDSRTFDGCREFFRIALPNTLMIFLDIWAWEAMMIFSGWLGVKEQAT